MPSPIDDDVDDDNDDDDARAHRLDFISSARTWLDATSTSISTLNSVQIFAVNVSVHW